MHRMKLMNNGWQFLATQVGAGYEEALQSDQWQGVDIPHDFLIHDTKNLYKTQTGWYKRVLPVENSSKLGNPARVASWFNSETRRWSLASGWWR